MDKLNGKEQAVFDVRKKLRKARQKRAQFLAKLA